jgi:hypothetical protein
MDIPPPDGAALERRSDAADGRAGLLLGVSGLLATLVAGGWPPFAISARFFAGLAGLAAIATLDLDTVPLGGEEDTERSRGLARYEVKLARLRLASRLVTAALAFATLAATVEGVG